MTYVVVYVQVSGGMAAKDLETAEHRDAIAKTQAMQDTAVKRGKPWKAYRLLGDDGHTTWVAERWDAVNSPLKPENQYRAPTSLAME